MASFSLRGWFCASKAFALDFSDRGVLLLELKGSGQKMRVNSSHAVALAEGVMENGVILNQQALVEALHGMVDAAKPKPPCTRRVVTALPDAQTFLHHFTLPGSLELNGLEEEVLKEAERTVPIPLEEYAWDFQVMARSPERVEVLFAAAPAEIVATYEQTLALAGLQLMVLEPEPLSLVRALVTPALVANGQSVAILDMGGRGSTLNFVDAGGVRLSVSRPEGGNAMSEALSQKTNVTTDTAEKRKREKGMKEKTVAGAAAEALEPLIREFAEARAAHERMTGQTVARVLFTGGSSRMPGLAEFLTSKLGLPVEPAAFPLRVTRSEAEVGPTAAAFGLAMRAIRLSPGINFIVPA